MNIFARSLIFQEHIYQLSVIPWTYSQDLWYSRNIFISSLLFHEHIRKISNISGKYSPDFWYSMNILQDLNISIRSLLFQRTQSSDLWYCMIIFTRSLIFHGHITRSLLSQEHIHQTSDIPWTYYKISIFGKYSPDLWLVFQKHFHQISEILWTQPSDLCYSRNIFTRSLIFQEHITRSLLSQEHIH